MQPTRRIAVLGAGSGGLAIAGALALQGHDVRLWNRSTDRIRLLIPNPIVHLQGCIEAQANLSLCTDDISAAVRNAELIFIVTTANAHRPIAIQLAQHLEAGQTILLNPGRTGGALEVRRIIKNLRPGLQLYIAEAQTLIFAARHTTHATVRIIGVKQHVPVAAFPNSDTHHVLAQITHLFPCFSQARHVLHSSFENIGAIFHPPIVLLNAALIERGQHFSFYQHMTPRVAALLTKLDQERLDLGKAYGLDLISIFDWIKYAYPDCIGETLCQRFQTNPAYSEIISPPSLYSRQLLEDLPTGLVPFVLLGQVAGLAMPLMRSMIDLGAALLDRDFWAEGRTLEHMGIAGLKPAEILNFVS